jgi:hypothetical protein
MLALVPAMVSPDSEDSEATSLGAVTQGKITNNGGGYLYIEFTNNEVERDVTITVVNLGNGETVGNGTITIPASESAYTGKIHVNLGGTGDYNVKVTCTPESVFDGSNYTTLSVSVVQDVWSDWVTYGALIVIALLVVVGAIVYSRSKPKIKADTTFTKLEAERAASGKVVAEEPTVERKRYNAEKPAAPSTSKKIVEKTVEKPVEKPVEVPTKKPSFTDLENEKASKKDENAEPKKAKYVSSRRK